MAAADARAVFLFAFHDILSIALHGFAASFLASPRLFCLLAVNAIILVLFRLDAASSSSPSSEDPYSGWLSSSNGDAPQHPFHGDAARMKLRQSKSSEKGRRRSAAQVELGMDDLDAEGFRHKVEAFIAKQHAWFRYEESLVARAAADVEHPLPSAPPAPAYMHPPPSAPPSSAYML